jgi:hypothetical protein
MPSRYLNREEAARYLTDQRGAPTAAATLAKLASIGGGPPYRRVGRLALYTLEDLDRWLDEAHAPMASATRAAAAP